MATVLLIDIADWETFQKKIGELRAEYGQKESSPLLFRGQGNSDWKLTTTLERSGATGMLFRQYYQLICARIAPAVKTFTGESVPEYKPDGESFLDPELLSLSQFPSVTLYRYMAYLRHHGFPSPLLDWSRSPFVAAFFAFREQEEGVERRSIFAYCESPRGVKGGALGEPTIHPIGPYVQTHHRHFRQQCDYTICGSWDLNYGWRFDSHEDVFRHSRPGQDVLWKFTLPSAERNTVLRSLNDHNLNAFSLFGSEESLLETMWLQEHVLREALGRAKEQPNTDL